MARVLLLGLMFWLAAPGHFAFAYGHKPLVETQYRMESVGASSLQPLASLAAARAADDWEPFLGTLSLGFGPQAFWVRVVISHRGSTGPYVLRMRPSFLDEVRVYIPAPDGSVQEQTVGDRSRPDMELGPYDSALTVHIPDSGAHAKREIYVRVQTTSTRMLGLWVLERSDAERAGTIENLAMGVYFGVMLCLLAWSVAHAMLDKDVVFAWYSGYQAASMMMNFGLLGYARLFLPDSWSPDVWSTAFVLSTSLLSPLFHLSLVRSVMSPAPIPTGIRAVLFVVFGVAVLNLVQVTLGRVGPALAVNANLLTLLSLVLAAMAVHQAVLQPQSPLRKLLLGYMLLCAITLVTLLPLVGFVQAGPWALYSTSVHGLMLALLLAAMLLVRRSDLKLQAERSRQQVVEEQARTQQAQQERDEKDRFLSMLTHELRTPLSVIRMVVDAALKRENLGGARRQLDLARGAVTDIDRVIEATLQVDRLERKALAPEQPTCDLGSLVWTCVSGLGEGDAPRVHCDVPAVPVSVRGDPRLLRLMVANLLDNALKYSPPASRVDLRVQARSATGHVGPSLRVSNLPGRAGRPDPSRVFQKFYRSEGAQHNTGSGQGLYLVYGLARHLGASVTCDPGQGQDASIPVVFELRW